MVALENAKTLKSVGGIKYTIVRFIAAGGQGEVYEVLDNMGVSSALKWYFDHSGTEDQFNRIKYLISRGAPEPKFLWPIDIVRQGKQFGYIMKLRNPAYKNITDLMKRRAEPTFSALCMAAINVADGYQSLHSSGLCYRDISFGNVFFNPQDGDVLICDNDNVTVNLDPNSPTNGTPRFIAPEIITSRVAPSTETDLYSMAVLLFYMFMLHHPLEGALEEKIRIFDTKAMEKIYGHEPVFIWDPRNTSNRPVPGYQQNAITFWKLYPPFLRDMFTQAFTEGLHNTKARVVEKQWKDAFAQLRDIILYCHNCSRENFFNKKPVCWACQVNISPPPKLLFGSRHVMLNRDSKIFAHHIRGDFDFTTVIGAVSKHPTQVGKWGLTNESADNWTFERANGDVVIVEPGKTAPIISGAGLNFGGVSAVIQ